MEEKQKAGRKTRDIEHRTVMQILEGSAIPAAHVVSELIRGTRKRISQQRWQAVVFDIEQCIGKARQKVEHSGGILTYGALVKGAEDLAKKQPELLIDPDKVAKN